MFLVFLFMVSHFFYISLRFYFGHSFNFFMLSCLLKNLMAFIPSFSSLHLLIYYFIYFLSSSLSTYSFLCPFILSSLSFSFLHLHFPFFPYVSRSPITYSLLYVLIHSNISLLLSSRFRFPHLFTSCLGCRQVKIGR